MKTIKFLLFFFLCNVSLLFFGQNNFSVECGDSVQLKAQQSVIKQIPGNFPFGTFSASYFLSPDTGFVFGISGCVMKTIDGGNSWKSTCWGESAWGRSMQFIDKNTGFITLRQGGIYKTDDCGETWNRIQDWTFEGGYICFPSSTIGYNVGEEGKIKKTTDAAVSWTYLSSGTTNNLNDVRFLNVNKGYVVGNNGTILKTINGGQDWIAQNSNVTNNLYSIVFFDENIGYISGDNGIILKTTNGGTNWIKQNTDTNSKIPSLAFKDKNIGYACGDNGLLLKTTDGGENWISQTVTVTDNLSSVFFATDDILYSVSEKGYFVKTLTNVDSYTWLPTEGLSAANIANPIAFPNATTTYQAVTTNGNISITSNFTVTVNPLKVNTGNDKYIVCGAVTQLNATTNTTKTDKLKYKWMPADGLDNDTISDPKATTTKNLTYTVTVTTPNGCTASDEVNVIVNPLTVNAGWDKTIVCGGSAQLENVTTNYTGDGALTYQWTPETGLDDPTIANPTVTLTNDAEYAITITTPNGCTATDVISVKIVPMNKPEIGIVGVNDNNKNLVAWNKPVSKGIEYFNIYRETNVTNVYEKIGSVSYDSLSVFIDNESRPDVQSNKYRLAIYDRSGLESPKSNAHKTMHLAVNKGIANAWNLSWEAYEGFVVSTYNIYRGTTPDNLALLGSVSGSSTQYNDLNAPANDIYYQLEVVSPIIVNPTKAPILSKTKALENSLSNSYNSSRSNIVSNVFSGVNDIVGSSILKIYPNPAKDFVTIELADDFNADELTISDLSGRVLLTEPLKERKIILNSNVLAKGTYLIRVNSVIQKLMIQ